MTASTGFSSCRVGESGTCNGARGGGSVGASGGGIEAGHTGVMCSAGIGRGIAGRGGIVGDRDGGNTKGAVARIAGPQIGIDG